MTRISLSLNLRQKIARAYGIWWDILNTGTVVFILAVLFIAFSVILIAGRLDLLPFQETVWKQFIETVPPQKQSEIGIGVLSISVSGASAAALYLIRIGTSRWAMNRRIGHIHGYFAEAILWRCHRSDCSHASMGAVVSSFVSSSLNVFEQISDTHPRAQIYFENARMKSHIFLGDAASGNVDAMDIALDLFAAAVLCQKTITVPAEMPALSKRIEERLARV